ncbi:MAG: winged helix DNA-binding protein [Alphaproteobacteria bacterium]
MAADVPSKATKASGNKGEEELDRGPLPGFLGWLLRRAERVCMTWHRDLMQEYAITPSQFEVLSLIRHNSGASQSAIARAVGVDRSTMVSLIDKLEAKELIKRMPDPVDRRAHQMHITDQGQTFHDELFAKAMERDRKFTADLSKEDRAVLRELLWRLGHPDNFNH